MRFLMVVLAVVLVLLQSRLWLSNGGLREVWRLEAEVDDLKSGLAAAEERARTELGMIHAGETFFQIAPAPPPAER